MENTYNVGSIVTYNGKEYKKQYNGKWMEVRQGLTKEEHLKIIKQWKNPDVIYKHKQVGSSLPLLKISNHRVYANGMSIKKYTDVQLNLK